MAFPLSVVMAVTRIGTRDSAMALNRALGRLLAHFRKLRSYSQRELAQRVGVVQVVVSDYEVGKLRISAEVALRFAAALDVPIVVLLQPSKPISFEPPHTPILKLMRRIERVARLPVREQD